MSFDKIFDRTAGVYFHFLLCIYVKQTCLSVGFLPPKKHARRVRPRLDINAEQSHFHRPESFPFPCPPEAVDHALIVGCAVYSIIQEHPAVLFVTLVALP